MKHKLFKLVLIALMAEMVCQNTTLAGDDLLRPRAMAEAREEDGSSKFLTEVRTELYLIEEAQEIVAGQLERLLPSGAKILDLMSGYNVYVPASLAPEEIIGVGLNKKELEGNVYLTGFLVCDLNKDPRFPAEWKNRFDAVLVICGMAYVENEQAFFNLTAGVLKPGGLLFIAFNDRYYPGDAADSWKRVKRAQRVASTSGAIASCGKFGDIQSGSYGYEDLVNMCWVPKTLEIITARRTGINRIGREDVVKSQVLRPRAMAQREGGWGRF